MTSSKYSPLFPEELKNGEILAIFDELPEGYEYELYWDLHKNYLTIDENNLKLKPEWHYVASESIFRTIKFNDSGGFSYYYYYINQDHDGIENIPIRVVDPGGYQDSWFNVNVEFSKVNFPDITIAPIPFAEGEYGVEIARIENVPDFFEVYTGSMVHEVEGNIIKLRDEYRYLNERISTHNNYGWNVNTLESEWSDQDYFSNLFLMRDVFGVAEERLQISWETFDEIFRTDNITPLYREGIDNNEFLSSIVSTFKWHKDTITYAFAPKGMDLSNVATELEFGLTTEYSNEEKAVFRNATNLISSYADIRFIEEDSSTSTDKLIAKVPEIATPNNPHIEYAGGYSGGPYSSNYIISQNAALHLATHVHELGHTLGLAHPWEEESNTTKLPGVGDDAFDEGDFGNHSPYWTVMSYGSATPVALKETGIPAPALGVVDVAALQYKYGANTTTNLGDSTYSPSNEYRVLWDAGGIDTISFEQIDTASVIDLRAADLSFDAEGTGGLSYTLKDASLINIIQIVPNALIENAHGGEGDDIITGNSLDNLIKGGAGNDTINGGLGSDTIYPGVGNDTISGGDGADKFLVYLGDGINKITDFTDEDSYSFLTLDGYQLTFSELTRIVNEDGNVVLSAFDGTSLIFDNITNLNNPDLWGASAVYGSSMQGQTLSVDVSSFSSTDGLDTLNYQWKADGVDISGATESTYTLTQNEVGKVITVEVSYIDRAGTTETVQSIATSAVGNVNDEPTGTVTVIGTPTQGQTLTAQNTLADADGLDALSYQWRADGVDISGATESTYTLTQNEVGKVITVSVSYVDGGGTTETVRSIATSAVENVNDEPTGTVTVIGTPTQGQTLTTQNTVADADGLGALSYQWRADGVDISGATESTYTLTQSEVGKVITVAVSYTDDGGIPESVLSSASATVLALSIDPASDIAVVQRGIVGKGVGSDSYIISPRLIEPDADITITDTGSNGVHLLEGLQIASGMVAPTALLLKLDNGAQITILDANDYSYTVGGDPLINQAGESYSFEELASKVLGASVPSSGISEVGSIEIGGELSSTPVDDLTSTADTVVVQRGIVGKGIGEDTYVLAQSWLTSAPEVTITDTGENTIQFIDGLELSSSMVAANAIMLTLASGGTVTILDASDYTYIVGGNPLLNGEGTPLSFRDFAEQVLSVEFPVSSQISNGGGVIVSESLLVDENLIDVVNGTVAQGSDGADTFVFALSSGGNFEIQDFDILQDQLSLSELSEADGSVLSDIVGDTGLGGEIITAQYDPFAGSLFMKLGIDQNGDIVSLNLAGLSDQDLSSVQLTFV